MNLIRPLQGLDQLVLNQFQKVTEKAHKKLGKTKYELIDLCNTGQAVAWTGMGCYTFIRGALIGGGFRMGAGGLLAALGAYIHIQGKKRIKEKEGREWRSIEQYGAVKEPRPNAVRGFATAVLAGWAIDIAARLTTGSNFTDFIPIEFRQMPEQYQFTVRAVETCFCSYYLFLQAEDYFHDTTLFPPKKSAQPWYSRMYHGIRNKFRPALQPQEVKVQSYIGASPCP